MRLYFVLALLLGIPLVGGGEGRLPERKLEIVDTQLPLMKAIAKLEGWEARGSLPRRLHNPGALIYVGQKAARRGERGFAEFLSDEAGWEALREDDRRKQERGFGPAEIGWARCGPGDDCAEYVRRLCGQVNCSE